MPEACRVKDTLVGWGVHFIKRIDWVAISSYGCVGFSCSLTFAMAWCVAIPERPGRGKLHDDVREVLLRIARTKIRLET